MPTVNRCKVTDPTTMTMKNTMQFVTPKNKHLAYRKLDLGNLDYFNRKTDKRRPELFLSLDSIYLIQFCLKMEPFVILTK